MSKLILDINISKRKTGKAFKFALTITIFNLSTLPGRFEVSCWCGCAVQILKIGYRNEATCLKKQRLQDRNCACWIKKQNKNKTKQANKNKQTKKKLKTKQKQKSKLKQTNIHTRCCHFLAFVPSISPSPGVVTLNVIMVTV